MEMKIYFPGEGKQVYADFKGFTHKTDQPAHAGGAGSAPTPFDLFLASMGTCAGVYVLGFCENRGIETKGIELIQNMEVDPATRLIRKVSLEIKLPADFPEKYKNAVIQAAQLCAVKKHLENPPEIAVSATIG